MPILKSRFQVQIPEIPVHSAICAKLAVHGDNIALVNGVSGRKFTFNQVERYSLRIGSALTRLGAKKGDLMAIYCGNCPEYSFIYLACLRTGIIVSGSNPDYTTYEMYHHLNDCQATFVFCMPSNIDTVMATIKNVPTVKSVITLGDVSGCVSIYELMKDDGKAYPEVSFNPRKDVVIVPYSSGTTGLPKGVMLTHYNILANIMQYGDINQLDPEDTENPYATIVLSVIPLFHVYGMMGMLTGMLMYGAQVITLQRFQPDHFLATIEKYKVTRLPLVPPLVIFLSKSLLVKKYDISSVKKVISGAASLSKETELAFRKRFKVGSMRQGYGMTEMTTVVTCPLPTHHKPGSVGVLIANTECQIVEPDTQRSVGANEKGEIWLRGPQMMKGYLGKPEATAGTIDKDGWLHTGDIGYYDNDGFFFITGRIKELIKYKGFQVAPAELESLLLDHPAVMEVAVIGVPDRNAGQLPRAMVVRTDRVKVTEQELYDHVKNHMINFKWLRGGVQFVTHIPKTASGKIIRGEVAKLMPDKAKL